MNEYIGTVGEKITATVTLSSVYEYTDTTFSYRGITNYIYAMKDEQGNVIVWKTTSSMGTDIERDGGVCGRYTFKRGDVLSITGKVKEHKEYKGVPQTVLTRCKYSLIKEFLSKEEKEEQERNAQLESLGDGDFIWDMPYKQYKQHYADCETVKGSYRFDKYNGSTIKVIIRNGRLKNSGVRGEHFAGYQFRTDAGKLVCYRAVCEENARKQMLKDYPNSENWELVFIFRNNPSRLI